MRAQVLWPEHAAFMEGLAAEGFIVVGGPLGDGERVLFLVEADSERLIRERLAEDPWVPLDLIRIASIEPWEILLGPPG